MPHLAVLLAVKVVLHGNPLQLIGCPHADILPNLPLFNKLQHSVPTVPPPSTRSKSFLPPACSERYI